MADTLYPSKVDSWLRAVFAFSILISVVACVPLFLHGTSLEVLFGILIIAVAVGLPAWLLCSTAYTLTDEVLVIRSGPFRWSVPLREIRSIEPTSNPLSSPALSLDRLRIDYSDRRSIMISPEDREAFLADLRRRGVSRISGAAV